MRVRPTNLLGGIAYALLAGASAVVPKAGFSLIPQVHHHGGKIAREHKTRSPNLISKAMQSSRPEKLTRQIRRQDERYAAKLRRRKLFVMQERNKIRNQGRPNWRTFLPREVSDEAETQRAHT